MKKIIPLIIVFGFIQIKLIGQKKIEVKAVEGTITETETGNPIYGATVYLLGTRIGTSADKAGKYKLSLPDSILQRKFFSICFNAAGYLKDTFKIETKGMPIQLNIYPLPSHVILLTGFNRNPIFGCIVNSDTHKPIDDVKISVPSFGSTTNSKDDGMFSVNVPIGTKQKKVTVHFSMNGFCKKAIKVDISSHRSQETIIRMVRRKCM